MILFLSVHEAVAKFYKFNVQLFLVQHGNHMLLEMGVIIDRT